MILAALAILAEVANLVVMGVQMHNEHEDKVTGEAYNKVASTRDQVQKQLQNEEMYGYGSSIYKSRRDKYNSDLEAYNKITKGLENPRFYDDLKYDPQKHKLVGFEYNPDRYKNYNHTIGKGHR